MPVIARPFLLPFDPGYKSLHLLVDAAHPRRFEHSENGLSVTGERGTIKHLHCQPDVARIYILNQLARALCLARRETVCRDSE